MIRNRTSFAPLACYISRICQIQLCMKRSIRPLQTFECIARLIQFRIRIEFQGSISKFGYNSSRRQLVYFLNLGQALFWHERIQYVFSGIRTKSKGLFLGTHPRRQRKQKKAMSCSFRGRLRRNAGSRQPCIEITAFSQVSRSMQLKLTFATECNDKSRATLKNNDRRG